MADKKTMKKNKWKSLCLSLKYRPKIMQIILKMRQVIRRRTAEIKSLKHKLKQQVKSYQTDAVADLKLSEEELGKSDKVSWIDTPKTFNNMSSQTPENKSLVQTGNSKENAMNIDQKHETKTYTEKSKGETNLEKLGISEKLCLIDKPKTFRDSSTQTKNESIVQADQSKKNVMDVRQKDETKTVTENSKIKQTDIESNDFGWKSGENEKSIAEQVKEAALNALNDFEKSAGWNVNDGGNEKSIAEQVKEVAQTALQQTGMVYVESAGMYYDYKTGYYYNSELGLYYHTETNCYYFLDEKQQFKFHSYPDTSAVNTNLIAHQKKKARKLLKRERKPEKDIDNLTQTLSQDNEESKKAKRRKIKKSKENGLSSKTKKGKHEKEKKQGNPEDKNPDKPKNTDAVVSTESFENNDVTNGETAIEEMNENTKSEELKTEEMKMDVSTELEDGECSDSPGEEENDDDDDDDSDSCSNASTATVNDDDTIAKHHPPCMRVIVRETDLPKLKVGSLFLVTKDGGTVGREGEQHTILIKDHNVSRNHLDVRYDMKKRTYVVTDLGSKNGTILNGNRMSASSEISMPMDILHGSTIQLGETKLLCHIHPGNDTCGHCEPGLLMESEEKEKKAAYTRTCSVKKQHELELARLKNIYAPKLLEIEETAYNDRAQTRRETVGSSHHSVKNETADINTSISTENKGFKLLQKMGWAEGEGLGKDCQGNVEPVPLVSNDGKAGLGTFGAVAAPSLVPKPRVKNTIASATLHLASRTKMLQPPAKVFQGDEEDSE